MNLITTSLYKIVVEEFLKFLSKINHYIIYNFEGVDFNTQDNVLVRLFIQYLEENEKEEIIDIIKNSYEG